MHDRYFPLVSYAVQSKGPIVSGFPVDNSLAFLSAYLLNAGYIPRIFDKNTTETVRKIKELGKEGFVNSVIDELDSFIGDTNSKIIGFKSYMNGFRDVVNITKELKRRRPKLHIAMGSAQANWWKGRMFDFTEGSVDFLIIKDGDNAIVPLAKFAYEDESINLVPNLMMSNGKTNRISQINMKNMPFPVYSKDVYPNIDEKMFIPVVEGHRGCSYADCSFCSQPLTGCFRQRPVDDVAREIEHNREVYKTRVTRLSDPDVHPAYLKKLLQRISPDQRISAFGYNTTDYDFDAIAEKVLGLFIGVESTNKYTLEKVLNKTKDADKHLKTAANLIKELQSRGTSCIASMMFPSPFETDETLKSNLEYIIKANPDFVPSLPLGPNPDTYITKMAMRDPEKAGLLLDDDYYSVYPFMDLDLLRPSGEWPRVPWKVKYNGKWEYPFPITQKFSSALIKEGIFPLSDENVLMSYLFYNSLSKNQKERRAQCLDLTRRCNKYLAESDYESLQGIVSTINNNNRKSSL